MPHAREGHSLIPPLFCYAPQIPRKGDCDSTPLIQLEESPTPLVDPSDRQSWRVLPDIWTHLSTSHADRVALVDPHRGQQAGMTYGQLNEAILNFAEGLRFLGLQQGDSASLFSDNSHRWLVADQGACEGVGGVPLRRLKSPRWGAVRAQALGACEGSARGGYGAMMSPRIAVPCFRGTRTCWDSVIRELLLLAGGWRNLDRGGACEHTL